MIKGNSCEYTLLHPRLPTLHHHQKKEKKRKKGEHQKTSNQSIFFKKLKI